MKKYKATGWAFFKGFINNPKGLKPEIYIQKTKPTVIVFQKGDTRVFKVIIKEL